MNTTARAALAVGSTFDLSGSLPYTLDGVKRVHSYTRRYRVTSATCGVDAEYVATITEDGRPAFAGNPVSVSLAAFAIPLYIANGRLTINA